MRKPVKTPTEDEFLRWMDEAQAWAATVGYEESDVDAAIQAVRGKVTERPARFRARHPAERRR